MIEGLDNGPDLSVKGYGEPRYQPFQLARSWLQAAGASIHVTATKSQFLEDFASYQELWFGVFVGA